MDVIGAWKGLFQPFDFRRFRAFPDKDIVQTVAQAFLDDNLIGAPSYIGMTSPTSSPIFVGVDDKTEYAANVNAYLSTRQLVDNVEKKLAKAAGSNLAVTKKNVFSDDLKNFDQL